jgi:hypothetical protein
LQWVGCRSSCIIHAADDDSVGSLQYCMCSCSMEDLWILSTPDPRPTTILRRWSHMAQLVHCCRYAKPPTTAFIASSKLSLIILWCVDGDLDTIYLLICRMCNFECPWRAGGMLRKWKTLWTSKVRT